MQPTWSKDGKELFYRTEDSRLWLRATRSKETPSAPTSRTCGRRDNSAAALTAIFDLHPDGQRFAVLKTPDSPAETKLDTVTLIFNFFDELRRMAPVTKR